MEDEGCFTFGKVIHVRRHSLVIREYDFAKDAEVRKTYYINRKTDYCNVKKLAGLKPGDYVVLDYLVKNKKRIITTIVKEEKEKGPEKPRKRK